VEEEDDEGENVSGITVPLLSLLSIAPLSLPMPNAAVAGVMLVGI
jgi:hypothetical protein